MQPSPMHQKFGSKNRNLLKSVSWKITHAFAWSVKGIDLNPFYLKKLQVNQSGKKDDGNPQAYWLR